MGASIGPSSNEKWLLQGICFVGCVALYISNTYQLSVTKLSVAFLYFLVPMFVLSVVCSSLYHVMYRISFRFCIQFLCSPVDSLGPHSQITLGSIFASKTFKYWRRIWPPIE